MKRSLLILAGFLIPLALAAQTDTVHWFPGYAVARFQPEWGKQMIGRTLSAQQPAELLGLFFPGTPDTSFNYLDKSEDPQSLRLWSCPLCPPIPFHPLLAESDTDRVFFPFEHHFTQLIKDDTLRSEAGERYRLLSFSTSEDYPPTGRWEYGLLGLALLREQAPGVWLVLDFNPSIDMNGMYMTAAAPDELTFAQNGNLLFSLNAAFPCGPPVTDYYPCFTDQIYYIFHKGKLKKALQISDKSCANFGKPGAKGSEWSSNIEQVPGGAEFPDLIVRRKGNVYLSDETYDWGLKSFPESFRLELKAGKNRRFAYTVRYTFRNEQYEIAAQSIK